MVPLGHASPDQLAARSGSGVDVAALESLRDRLRQRFPALAQPIAFLENAGGSQVPLEVAEAIRSYMLESYVQLGAGYPLSDTATANVDRAHCTVETLVNAPGCGKVILGPSSTQLCSMLASCYADRLRPDDEVVVAANGHEANVGPWLRLERRGVRIRWWRVDPGAEDCTIDGLNEVLGKRTRLVAFPHVSNLLGRIADVAEITRCAHRVGARVIVDGVAFAPHRLMDVAAWGVDWYVYSTYKVYGPHMGALFGRTEALAELEGPNHFFIPHDAVPYKFELGGASHEGCAAINALGRYLASVAEVDEPALSREVVERAFHRFALLEEPLQEALVRGLGAISDVRLVGGRAAALGERVPTISFLHARRSPTEVTSALHARGIACRHGHMYSHRLCEALGIPVGSGVVRLSAVHYNTPEEVRRAIAAVAAL